MTIVRTAAATLALAAVLLAACDTDPRQSYTTLPETVPTAAPTTLAPPNPCNASPATPVTYAYDDIPSVDENLLSVDVYPLPESCGPRPVVFWVHGGGWTSGDKAGDAPGEMTGLERTAAQYGWVLVSLNYRLSTEGAGVVWPAQGDDVSAAIAYTLDHSRNFGIDPERIAVIGHGSGGQLAAIVAVDPTVLEAVHHSRDEIGCLVSLDTDGYSLTGMIDSEDEATVAMVENAFGADFQTYQKASPSFVLTQVKGKVADTLVVTRGDLDRQAIAVDFSALVEATGATATVVIADGYSQADVGRAAGDASDTVVYPAVTAFLTTCLA